MSGDGETGPVAGEPKIRLNDIRPGDIRPRDIRPRDIRPRDIRPRDIGPGDIGLDFIGLDGIGPVWLQVRRAIARPILSEIWGPGTRIPSEIDLMARYKVARMTVHRAIQSLAAEGLVERRRKRGTIVAPRPPERPIFEIWDVAAEVARQGAAYRFDILERSLVDKRKPPVEASGSGLGVHPDVPLLSLTVRHFAGDAVFQLEERLINLEAAPEAAGESFAELPPSSWLLRHVRWTEAEHGILALSADALRAERLGIPPASACLVVERRTWNERTPVTFARLWHAGDRHRLVGRFTPSRA